MTKPKPKSLNVRLIRQMKLFLSFRYRLLTSSHRVLPNYIVIGGQKCGTTSLHDYIKRHPNIIPPHKKDSSFFDANYFRGYPWYRAHFPLQSEMDDLRAGGKNFITGEVTTTYLFHPSAAERVAHHLPSIKLIALLRNPAIRAYSQYHHMVRTGRENLSFKEAIEAEDNRLAGVLERVKQGDHVAHKLYRNFSYKARGRYAEQLKNWFKYFSREQFLILKSEDLFDHPEAVCRQVYSHLGIPDFKLGHYDNANPGNYPEADLKIIKELEEYFASYNEELYSLINTEFGW